jgi:hypothetical protein
MNIAEKIDFVENLFYQFSNINITPKEKLRQILNIIDKYNILNNEEKTILISYGFDNFVEYMYNGIYPKKYDDYCEEDDNF